MFMVDADFSYNSQDSGSQKKVGWDFWYLYSDITTSNWVASSISRPYFIGIFFVELLKSLSIQHHHWLFGLLLISVKLLETEKLGLANFNKDVVREMEKFSHLCIESSGRHNEFNWLFMLDIFKRNISNK